LFNWIWTEIFDSHSRSNRNVVKINLLSFLIGRKTPDPEARG
jgi:hypothetical protein